MSVLRVMFALLSLVLALRDSAAQEPAAPRFSILEFEVEGNSVLAVPAIEAAVLPFMGEDRQLDDVEKAREALEKVYQQAGYLSVFVDVPEQRVDSGVVRLRVTEGRIDRLRVTGSRYYDQGVIRERVGELAPGKVPDFNAMQRQIAALSRDERQLQPVLRPGREPGTVEAELKVTDQLPLSGTVELNNRHAAGTEPWRLSATARYDNLFQRDHSIAVTGIVAPQSPSQSKVLLVNYTVPLSERDTLVLYAVHSDSLVEPLGSVSVLGQGVTVGARWLRSFFGPDSSHTVGVGLDYKDLDQRTSLADVDAVTNPVRYLPLQASYTGAWFGDKRQTTLATQFVFGVRGLFLRSVACTSDSNVGPIDQFQCSRDGADGGFAYWRGDLRHSRPMPAGLPGTLALRFGWQLASQPLVSGEQYALGGAETVRGYLEAEASGDHGLLGSAEWRSPSLVAAGGLWDEVSVLGFVDVARTQLTNAAAGQASRTPMLGSGVGLRVRAARRLLAEVDIAKPFKTTPSTPDKDPRVHVRLQSQF